MKNIFFTITLIGMLLSCKKEDSSQTNNNQSETTKNTSDLGLVNSIDCSSLILIGKLKKGELSNSVSFTIEYSGGNGKAFNYQLINSTGVNGLTAKLESGILANGNGKLIYLVSGTPNSFGLASFVISIGGKTCTLNLNVDDTSQNPKSGYGQNISDIDGNIYKTVYIGDQHWMAENLNTSKYNDGTLIQNEIDRYAWFKNTPENGKGYGTWCYYSSGDTIDYRFGKIYNGYAVLPYSIDKKNICPVGWHLPSVKEWEILIDYLGGNAIAAWKLKEKGIENWNVGNSNSLATNSSLFSALPGGKLDNYHGFWMRGEMGYWWTSEEDITAMNIARGVAMDCVTGNVYSEMVGKTAGYYVRCIKD
jgi:uncharacterized protein (TIGR02145 family)